MTENPPYAEMFWAGYLAALIDSGSVTATTPHAEVEQIKADFMVGMRGEHMPCQVEARTE